ncbi:ATP-binding protein [Streptomyces sp. SID4946]|nr:ATP-binding protein [Streptomyces sp. SID4946]
MCTGRLSESRALRAAADSARAGTATVVLVQGPPGIGKTTLVRQFLAGLSDFAVLDSTATPPPAASDVDCLSRLLHRAAVRVPDRSPAGGRVRGRRRIPPPFLRGRARCGSCWTHRRPPGPCSWTTPSGRTALR